MLLRYGLTRGIARGVTLASLASIVAFACGDGERTGAARVPDHTDAGAAASGGAAGASGSSGATGGAAGAGGSAGTAGAAGATPEAGTDADAQAPGSIKRSTSIATSVRAAVMDIASDGINVTLALEVWGDGEIGGKGVSLERDNVTLVGYDGAGNYAWHRMFDAQFLQSVQLEADPAGNLYLVGIAEYITLGSEQLRFDGDYTLFVAKLSPTGEPIWSKAFRAGFGYEWLKLGADPQGNLLISGELGAKGVDFGAGVQLAPGDGDDFYVARLDALGNPSWIKKLTVSLPALGIDASGASVIAGFGPNAADLGGSAIDCPSERTCLAAAGFDAAGNRSWLKQWVSFEPLGGSLYDLIVRPSSIFMLGTGWVDFAADGVGVSETYLTTLDRTGAFVRGDSISGGHEHRAAFSASGDLYLAGTLSEYLRIGDKTLQGAATAYEQLYVAGFDAAGAVRFAKMIGKSASEVEIVGITSTASGLAVAGNYWETLELDRAHERRSTSGQAAAFVAFLAP